MNIVVIGYRGTGKTTISKKLAERLKKKYVSTDNLIIKKAGMLIPEIVEKHGWHGFRDMESEVTNEVAKLDNYIIDTGGGIILRKINVKHLKERGILILLKSDVKTIIKRIKDNNERPSLTGIKSFTEEVEYVLKERSKMYEESADYVIDTSTLTVTEVVDKIIRHLNQKRFLKD